MPWRNRRFAVLGGQADHHVHADDFGAFGRGYVHQRDEFFGNVEEFVAVFEIEMIVRADLGVVPGLGAVERDLADEPVGGEVAQRVVDGGERRRIALLAGFGEQGFSRQVAVALGEQQFGDLDALPRRAQARVAQGLAIARLPPGGRNIRRHRLFCPLARPKVPGNPFR